MEAIMSSDWIGLIIIGLGTLFLLGEILVNMRGVFAVLGIIFTVYYFYMFLTEPTTIVIMLIIYFVGLLLIFIDGKLINDGTLATLGLAGMILSVALTAPNFFAGLYAVIGVILGGALSFTFLKVFKRRNMWSKIALKDRLTKEAGYSSLNENYVQLVGKTGTTLTDLRPVGTIAIDGKDYSAISNAQWIKKGTVVQVTEVDGTRILVKEI
ncbi:NfeD family protein [Pseudogracilibacillus sp. SO30301A]|uniref:NfeD family protein n=1 Tax=Pseudogracilibacillus sp. SO30301A TaxID=3098291 RepID=UPI00300E43D1